MMDLVTLVTICSLGVDPKLMHALIWHQSGGEPWAVAVPGEPSPRVYTSMREAISETHARPGGSGAVRVGLVGLSTDPHSATAAMLLPCPNIATAARQIAQLTERCKTIPHFNADPTFCAVAAYRGSWERPDTRFAEAVRMSVAKGDSPNFDMPKETGVGSADAASEAPAPDLNPVSAAPTVTSDDRERGWSSALFPAIPQQPKSESTDSQPAEEARSPRMSHAHPSTAKPRVDSLFVPRSSDRRPQ